MTSQTSQTDLVARWHDLNAHQAGIARARAHLRLTRILGYTPTPDPVVVIDEDAAIIEIREDIAAQVTANRSLAALFALPDRITH